VSKNAIWGLLIGLIALAGADAHAQINDNTHWVGETYPELGFSASWPDNWKVTQAPSTSSPRLTVGKHFEENKPEEGASCEVEVTSTPSTSGMNQATLDADAAAKHLTNAGVAAALSAPGSATPQVYNTSIRTIAGHPAITYETTTTKLLQSGKTISTYVVVATLRSPGREYNFACGTYTQEGGERASMLIGGLTGQTILRIMTGAKIF
jgi:hypothetical protein